MACICLYSSRLVDPVIFTIDSVVEQVHTGLGGGSLKEGHHLEDTGADGRIILKWIFKKGMEDMD